MQINFNQLSIDKIFMLSKHIKELCNNLSSFEEVAQELTKIIYTSFVTEDGRCTVVLTRFFKVCTYGELPDDIRNYIHNKYPKENPISDNKYLTLLGSYGELDNWKDRNLSENYKAFPLHDEHMLEKFPMLSAAFDQIGLKLSHLQQTDKSILIRDRHRQYGVFCVEDAEGSILIPKQAEFVRPYSVKSVFGFGGIYSTSNAYAVLVFSRERLSRENAQLFLSLNPAIKQITLAHEITGNIIKSGRKDTNASVDGLCDEIPTVQMKSHNKTISPQHKDIIEREMAITSSIELEMANEYLLRMSEALKESERKYRSLVETTNTIPWEFDISSEKFTFIGSKAAELFGYPVDEWFKKDFWPNIIHPDDREDTVNRFFAYTEKSEDHMLEYRIMTADNKIIWVYDVVHVIDCDDGTKRLQGIIVNVTEHKMMEEALLQSEKLRSIGIITAGISHEFNNLLAIISGNVQLLEGTYKDDKVLTNALCTIMKATDDGAEISSNMLKFTKTQPDTEEFVFSDIRDFIIHSIDFTKPRWKNEAQAKGIDYKIDTDSVKKVPYIMCKPVEIREVFVNIINNALDAMPGGGSISFSTRSADDTVIVSITDTGEGMSENVKKNIFDPFFTTKTPLGTGLGMSMSYGIITRHSGNIAVESEVGKGSTFTLQFPVASKRAHQITIPEQGQETKCKHLSIMVVDDEEAIGDIMDIFLSRCGHKVKIVNNGAEAIEVAKAEDFDLILCDLAMPNVFGYDVIKVINGLEKKPKIGIVTGWGEELKPIDEEGMKVDFILRKPFKHAELAKQINQLFGADSK